VVWLMEMKLQGKEAMVWLMEMKMQGKEASGLVGLKATEGDGDEDAGYGG